MADVEVEVDPYEVGIDPVRIESLGMHLAKYVDDGRLPGVNVLLSRAGKVVPLHVWIPRSRKRSASRIRHHLSLLFNDKADYLDSSDAVV